MKKLTPNVTFVAASASASQVSCHANATGEHLSAFAATISTSWLTVEATTNGPSPAPDTLTNAAIRAAIQALE